MHKAFDGMGATEQSVELTGRIDDDYHGRVIDGIVVLVAILFLKIDAQSAGQISQLIDIACDAEIALAKRTDILRHFPGRIARGVYADQDDARQGRKAGFGELTFRRAEHLQCDRADVGAIRKAKENQVPVACENAAVNCLTVVVEQVEFRQFGRRGQYGRGREFGSSALQIHGRPDADGQGRAEHERNDKVFRFHFQIGLQLVGARNSNCNSNSRVRFIDGFRD